MYDGSSSGELCLGLFALRARGSHARSIVFPRGNEGFTFVHLGNRLAAVVALLTYYSLSQGCRVLIEQPQGSLACEHPRLEVLLRELGLYQASIWGGTYCQDATRSTPKRHVLYSQDYHLLSRLQAAAGYLSAERLAELRGPSLVKKQKRADGTYSWSGNKAEMKESQNLWRD